MCRAGRRCRTTWPRITKAGPAPASAPTAASTRRRRTRCSSCVCMLTSMGRGPCAQSMDSLAEPPSLPTPKRSPALARLYARPGFLLRRAHQISAAVFEEECRPLQLTPAQFGVLTVLSAHPGLGQSSLARALGFDKVTVLRVLRGLEARGLVSRHIEGGRRNVAVWLTEAGAALLDQAGPRRKAYRRLMGPLDRGQQQQLISSWLQSLTGTGRRRPRRLRPPNRTRRALPAWMPQRARAGVVRLARDVDPLLALRRALLLPERRLRLQVVDQEIAGLESLAAVRRGDADEHADLVARAATGRCGGSRARRRCRTGRCALATMASIARSVMPG